MAGPGLCPLPCYDGHTGTASVACLPLLVATTRGLQGPVSQMGPGLSEASRRWGSGHEALRPSRWGSRGARLAWRCRGGSVMYLIARTWLQKHSGNAPSTAPPSDPRVRRELKLGDVLGARHPLGVQETHGENRQRECGLPGIPGSCQSPVATQHVDACEGLRQGCSGGSVLLDPGGQPAAAP